MDRDLGLQVCQGFGVLRALGPLEVQVRRLKV